MTVADLRCDRCGRLLAGPGDEASRDGPFGIRFLYHPGDPLLRDDSGLMCQPCWDGTTRWLGSERPEGRCAVCAEPAGRRTSLHLHRAGDPIGWQLCTGHAVEFLNGLRTVEPKLDPQTFALPARDSGHGP